MTWDGEGPPRTIDEYHDYLIEHLKADHLGPEAGGHPLIQASSLIAFAVADQLFPQQAHEDGLLSSLAVIAEMALIFAHFESSWVKQANLAEYRESEEYRQKWPVFEGLAEKIVAAFPAPEIPLDDLM